MQNGVTEMASKPRSSYPNPRRVAAGRQNRAKAGPITDTTRELLRQAAYRTQPWRFATGPKTPAGKARSASNARVLQKGLFSVRELRRDIADLHSLVMQMRQTRSSVKRLVTDAQMASST